MSEKETGVDLGPLSRAIDLALAQLDHYRERDRLVREHCPYPKFCKHPHRCANTGRCQAEWVCND